jgi:hypothetical protein
MAAKVKTDSTHPPAGLFAKSARTIAKTLASKKVSPKGPTSGMRMLTYFMARPEAGSERRVELEKQKSCCQKGLGSGGRQEKAIPGGVAAASDWS